MMKRGNKHWWVVQTKPQAENLAMSHLEQQGMTTYCPMYQKETIHGRQVKTIVIPLFPRYGFVLANPIAQHAVHAIRSTRGVNRLLRVGDMPSTMDASIVDEIRELEAQHLNQTDRYFKPNDEVRITGGLYQGLEAIYQMDKGLERAVVMLNLLQRETQLTINKTQLKKMV